MNRIKELREEKGITQIRLSIELSVSQETVSAYENGKHFPSVQSLIKISEIFNVSCDYILGLSDVKNIQNGGAYTIDEISLVSVGADPEAKLMNNELADERKAFIEAKNRLKEIKSYYE